MSIIPFTYEGTQVRTLTVDGEPWFVARDVCTVLGISNSRDAVGRLDSDGVGSTDVIDSMGRTQATSVINESSLYELIFQSRRPEAKAFRRWVTHEVIPSIRRTGRYEAVPQPALPDMATPDGRRAVAKMLLDSVDREIELTAKVAELEPKALAHDTLMSAASGDVLVRQAAKLLGWREKDLRQFLVDERFIYHRQALCGAGQWDFYAAHKLHFSAVETPVQHTWGQCAHYTLYVTPQGLSLIQRRIEQRRSEMDAAIRGDQS